MYQKIIKKLAIFAFDSKLDQATETLVLTSASKFLWLALNFDRKLWFSNETEIVLENSYSGIWPFLEIHTLKFLLEKCNRLKY